MTKQGGPLSALAYNYNNSEIYTLPMKGELADDYVIVKDQTDGNHLYGKGNYGYPRSGGGVDLDLLEATLLTELGKLEVLDEGRKLSFEEIFKLSSDIIDGFDILDAEVFDRFVGKGRDGLLFDFVDEAMEGRVFAGEFCDVLFGEGDVDVFLFAGLDADEGFFKTGDERMGAEDEIIVLAFAAFEGDAIDEPFEIEVHGVTHLSGALDVDQIGRAKELFVDGFGDFFFGDFDFFLIGVELGVFA